MSPTNPIYAVDTKEMQVFITEAPNTGHASLYQLDARIKAPHVTAAQLAAREIDV